MCARFNISKWHKKGKYTKPGLRERIKKRIMAGSKGGKPGQWSARKAQMLAKLIRRRAEDIKVARVKNRKISNAGERRRDDSKEYEKKKND